MRTTRMKKTDDLPQDFRIEAHLLRRGDADDPYDSGEWTYRLDHWETRTVGMLWWKKPVSGWWPVEYSTRRETLIQTATLLEQDWEEL